MGLKNRWLTDLRRERYGPLVLGVLTGAAVWAWQAAGYCIVHDSSRDDFFASVLALGGVLAGFMATLNALLFTLPPKVYARLKSTTYLFDLIRYVKEATSGGLALCLLGLAAFFSKGGWVDPLVGGVAMFVFAAVWRVSSISTALLSTRE